jgi:hypothetical protein
MRFRRTFAFVLAVAGITPCSFSAQAQLSQVEYQYIYAIRQNDIAKARTLRKMANIDPTRMSGGRTLIGSVPEFAGSFLHLKPAAYDYVVKELKQDLNTPLPGYDGSIFATFCFTLSAYDELHAGRQEEFWQQSIKRINEALDHGARATPLANIPPHAEPGQPLPMCVKAYLAVRHIPARAEDMLNIIQRLIKAGANPNTPVFRVLLLARAVETLDVPLLETLVDQGADINATYPAQPGSPCSLPKRVTNTVLAYVPDPDDRALEPARRFLVAFIRRGGDVLAPRHRSDFSAGSCITTAKTLKQRALDRGQVRYAQMVDAIEETQSNLPPKFVNVARSAPATSAGGPLRVTVSLNTRQSPSTSAPIVRTLAPGDAIALQGHARDGWSSAKLADGTAVWVNLAALAKNSAAHAPTPTASTAKVAAETDTAAHLQAVALVIQGSPKIEPHTITTLTKNSYGTPAWERRLTTTIVSETPCRFRVVTESSQRVFNSQTRVWEPWKSTSPYSRELTFRFEQRFDFTKATALKIERMTDPEEAFMRSIVNRPGNYFPPMINRLSFRGAGTVCPLGKRTDGSAIPCSTNDESGAFRDTREPGSMIRRAQAAFATIKSRCPTAKP